MPEIPIVLEVERVMNLVRGFGWEKKEERVDAEYVYLVIQKKVFIPTKGIPA